MDDTEIIHTITKLTDEEHHLLQLGEQNAGLEDSEREQLKGLQVELDRLWDLLRQRRARRAAGLNPDNAEERDANTVERYQQ